jgi:membrane-associated phospholipid phosphatase
MTDAQQRRGNARAVNWVVVLGGWILAYVVGYGCGRLFQALGWWIGGGAWERDVLVAVHRTVSPGLDLIFLWLPYLGTNYTLAPMVAIGAIILWRKKLNAAALHMVVIQAGSWALNPALKFTFNRPRPDLFPMRGQFALPAFPSGHSLAVASVMFTAAYLLYRYRGATWGAWAVLVFFLLNSYSRVYLAVHWPTDVIAGTLIGLVWFTAGIVAFRRAHPVRTTP